MSKDLYRDSGVDIDRGDALVGWLKEAKSSNHNNPFGKPLDGLGGFSGMFLPSFTHLKRPVLVAGTDGVGTKLLLGLEKNLLGGLGQDLVAMCVNDLYCVGATPLFFLDYYASGKLDDDQFKIILSSIKGALGQCQTYLLGGETAELPDLYQHRHFDLAGFVVGVVDYDEALSPSKVKAGDTLLGITSSGFHSNGYSLIRKFLKQRPDLSDRFYDQLLTPTKIYHGWPQVLKSTKPGSVHALANITGGGISGNLVRIIPNQLRAIINKKSVQPPGWMVAFLSEFSGDIWEFESVFNLGLGMIAAVDGDESANICLELAKHDIDARVIGKVETKDGDGETVCFS